MNDLDIERRLSEELQGADWSLEPPDEAKDVILTRVARRRRTFHVLLAGGATAAVVTSAVVVWPAVTDETATGPTHVAHQTPTNPPTNPHPHSLLPSNSVMVRLGQYTWHVKATAKTPDLTRQEAVALARATTGFNPKTYPGVRTWLVSAISLRDGIDLTCFAGCSVNPAWLVQLHQPLVEPGSGVPLALVDRLLLIDATTGHVLLKDPPQRHCYQLTTDSCPPVTPPDISTSTWRPGDSERTAVIRGVLRYTDDGCPYLREGATNLWVVWPAGYHLRNSQTGTLTLVGPDGLELRAGDMIEASGAVAGASAQQGMPCIPEGATLTTIESSISKLNR